MNRKPKLLSLIAIILLALSMLACSLEGAVEWLFDNYDDSYYGSAWEPEE